MIPFRLASSVLDEGAGSSRGQRGRHRAAADSGCHQSRYCPAEAADGKADSASISFSCAPCETSQPGKWTCAGAREGGGQRDDACLGRDYSGQSRGHGSAYSPPLGPLGSGGLWFGPGCSGPTPLAPACACPPPSTRTGTATCQHVAQSFIFQTGGGSCSRLRPSTGSRGHGLAKATCASTLATELELACGAKALWPSQRPVRI